MSGLSKEKIVYLCRVGLAGDQTRLGMYVQAMDNPYGGVADMVQRNYVAEVLDKILDYMAKDQLIYDHLAHDLERDHPPSGRPWMRETAWDALEHKAEKSGVPNDVLVELYNRGYNQDNPPHLTREQNAFNCINSFIAKGKAWRDYPDLVEMSLNVDDRLWGTTSLTDTYKADTPGQNLNIKKQNKQGTFDKIKKVINK